MCEIIITIIGFAVTWAGGIWAWFEARERLKETRTETNHDRISNALETLEIVKHHQRQIVNAIGNWLEVGTFGVGQRESIEKNLATARETVEHLREFTALLEKFDVNDVSFENRILAKSLKAKAAKQLAMLSHSSKFISDIASKYNGETPSQAR